MDDPGNECKSSPTDYVVCRRNQEQEQTKSRSVQYRLTPEQYIPSIPEPPLPADRGG
jgi:hypothetical protein